MDDSTPPASPTPVVAGRGWQGFEPPFSFLTGARTVTEADLVSFVGTAGLTEPLFLDARWSAEHGFAGRLVPAALTFALAEGLLVQTNILAGTARAFLGMELSVKLPVVVGDTLSVLVEAVSVRPTSQGRGIVETRNTVRNQRNEDVLVYLPLRIVAPRPE